MSGNYSVYMHTSPSGKRYVGVTKNRVKQRWDNGRGYKNQVFGNAVNKYKWQNIRHEILLTGLSKEQAEHWERFFVALFRTESPKYGYNCDSGGGLGKEISLETRLKISNTLRGRRPSDKAVIEATKARSRSVVNLDTGKRFDSILEASIFYHISRTSICNCLAGTTKRAGGYHWAYFCKDEEKTNILVP